MPKRENQVSQSSHDPQKKSKQEHIPMAFRVSEVSKKNQKTHTLFFKEMPTLGYDKKATLSSGDAADKMARLNDEMFFFSSSSGPDDHRKKTSLFHGVSHDLSVALAVICGKFYRLMLGASLPRTYLGFETNTKRAYRISEEIKCLPYDRKAEVLGTVLMLFASYAFKEDDYENDNVLYNKAPNGSYRVVKIDPEYGFYKRFSKETESDVQEHLQFLLAGLAVSSPPSSPIDQQVQMEDSSESQDSQSDSDDADEEYDFENLPKLFALFFSYNFFSRTGHFGETFANEQKRIEEFKVGLCLFLRHDKERYGRIVDKVLNSVTSFNEIPLEDRNDFANLEEFKEAFKNRFFTFYDWIKNFAVSLDGFQTYFAEREYQNTAVYQAYFPESEMKQEKLGRRM